MGASEILLDNSPQMQTGQGVLFAGLPVFQAAVKAGEEVIEGGVAPSSLAVLCAEEAEDLLEHLAGEAGALCLSDLGDSPSFPRNSGVGSALQACERGDISQLCDEYEDVRALWAMDPGRCSAREQAGTQGSGAAATSQERWAVEEFSDRKVVCGRCFQQQTQGKADSVPQSQLCVSCIVPKTHTLCCPFRCLCLSLSLWRRHFQPGGSPAPCFFWVLPGILGSFFPAQTPGQPRSPESFSYSDLRLGMGAHSEAFTASGSCVCAVLWVCKAQSVWWVGT